MVLPKGATYIGGAGGRHLNGTSTMKSLARAVLFVAVALPFLADGALGAARKCPGAVKSGAGSTPVPSGSTFSLLTLDAVTVDGVLVDASTMDPESMDIVEIGLGCIMVQENGRLVKRDGVAIVTRDGAVGVMRSYLADLVMEQEAFRTTYGQYARDLYSLGFFATRPQFSGIEMVSVDGGWTATLRFRGLDTSCRVSRPVAPAVGLTATVETITCQ